MSRITEVLQQCRASGRKALVTYIVNGDPRPEVTLAAMHALVAAGADIIELGVPFSDPMAEGPVIQKGHERALVHHTSLAGCISLVGEFRQTNRETPVVLMGYANPLERMGYGAFGTAASAAGVDGLLTVDLPPEEASKLKQELAQLNLDTIYLIAPTTTEQRIASIVSLASGFVYYVSLKGVTGAGHLDADSVQQKVTEIRRHTALPLLVGFGIKDADSAKAIGACADGVVVGSVLVKAMGEATDQSCEDICQRLTEITASIRSGLDSLS
ncbi:MAG: tryptophan synthase subunit alpha [Cellvibrionaceae bacterium]|nr:tryptophan synthase subunit alpha [Cellvibrionaceae bacterium]